MLASEHSGGTSACLSRWHEQSALARWEESVHSIWFRSMLRLRAPRGGAGGGRRAAHEDRELARSATNAKWLPVSGPCVGLGAALRNKFPDVCS